MRLGRILFGVALVVIAGWLGNRVQAKPSQRADSVLRAEVAAALEVYLNEVADECPFGNSRQVRLNLSKLQSEGLSSVIMQFDSLTRQISRLHADGRLAGDFYLKAYWDEPTRRFWFSRIDFVTLVDATEGIFPGPYELQADPRGGIRRFLLGVAERLRQDSAAGQFVHQDTLIMSLVVDTDGRILPDRFRVNGMPNPRLGQLVADLGEWSPAIHYGYPVRYFFEAEFYRRIRHAQEADSMNRFPFDGRRGELLLFPGVPHGEYLWQGYRDQTELGRDGLVVVSFMLNARKPVLYGPLIHHGSEARGQRLLSLIREHLPESAVLRTDFPGRMYFSFPAEYLD